MLTFMTLLVSVGLVDHVCESAKVKCERLEVVLVT